MATRELISSKGRIGDHAPDRPICKSVECLHPPIRSQVVIDDPTVVADSVASVADHYQSQVSRPWFEIVEECRQTAKAIIDRDGRMATAGEQAPSPVASPNLKKHHH